MPFSGTEITLQWLPDPLYYEGLCRSHEDAMLAAAVVRKMDGKINTGAMYLETNAQWKALRIHLFTEGILWFVTVLCAESIDLRKDGLFVR